MRPTNDSYRVDETYVKVKGEWKYLYRVVDSTGQTIDFRLSAKRDAMAAKRACYSNTAKSNDNGLHSMNEATVLDDDLA